MERPLTQTKLPDESTAFTLLYQRYARAILIYIRQQMSQPDEAEDILVEVFMAAFHQPDLINWPEKEQWYWLRRVAQNKIVDAYRHTQKQQHLPLEEAANCADDEYTLPETVALRQEQLTQLCLHLAKLPALQQLVIRLRFTYDLSHREIADQIGKRETAVRVLLHRTLKQLRTMYTQREV